MVSPEKAKVASLQWAKRSLSIAPNSIPRLDQLVNSSRDAGLARHVRVAADWYDGNKGNGQICQCVLDVLPLKAP